MPQPLTRNQKLVLAGAALALLHYVVSATRSDPLNLGVLISLGIALAGFGWVVATRAGLRLPPLRPWVRRSLQAAALTLVCAFTAIVVWMIAGARSDESPQVDVVLVLGAGLRNGRPTLTLQRRIQRAADWLVLHPDVKVVACGGCSPGQPLSEAEAIRSGLVARGVAFDRVIIEDRSTSTEENVRNAYSLWLERGAGQRPRALIVTSNFHLARAKLLANRAGFGAYGIGASTPWYILPGAAIREAAAIAKAWVIDSRGDGDPRGE